jgi:hypothetical protein
MKTARICTIAAAGIFAVASLATAGPGAAGHAGGMAAGAMGGGMRPTATTGPGQTFRDTASAREMRGPAHPSIAAHADPATLLGQNSQLNSRLQKLLPADTSPRQACAGFSQLGRCVAALHVASNLGIPFADLKSRITGSEPVSLGSAIHELKPDADADRVERKAQRQTQRDLDSTSE